MHDEKRTRILMFLILAGAFCSLVFCCGSVEQTFPTGSSNPKIPAADAYTISDNQSVVEKSSALPMYSIISGPVPAIQTGHPLEITGISDAPDGTVFLITGESFYYRMHSHQKAGDYSHDIFTFRGIIRNKTSDQRGFTAVIDTENLRPDWYFVTISINELSINQSHIRLEFNQSRVNQEIFLNLVKTEYRAGDTIHVSGRGKLPDAGTVYVNMVMDPAQDIHPDDDRTGYLVQDFLLSESKNPGYPEFEGDIDTAGLLPGDYLLQIISFNQQGDGRVVMNQTRLSLTDFSSAPSQQKSSYAFPIPLLLTITAILLVLRRPV